MTIQSSKRGSSLLIVLWAVVMMAVCVLGLVEYVYSNLDETTTLAKDSRAYQLALSGIALGLHPLVLRGDPVLKQVIAPGEVVEAHLRSEGGRLNINTVLLNKNWSVLENLFLTWGLHEGDVANVVNSFQAWSSPRLGASGGALAIQPPNTVAGETGTAAVQPAQPVRIFQSVDEMLTIPGMDLVAGVKPDWKDYFTIWSDGGLDMNDAPADLISAVCGVSMLRADELVNVRLGPDGKRDTDDDVTFKTLDEVRALLGMSQDEFSRIQGQLSLQDSTIRIESTGSFGAYQRMITAVVRRNTSPPTFLQWQE